MTFPQIVGALIDAGRELRDRLPPRHGDLLSPDGDSIELPTQRHEGPVAASLDAPAVQAAIRDAQQLGTATAMRASAAA